MITWGGSATAASPSQWVDVTGVAQALGAKKTVFVERAILRGMAMSAILTGVSVDSLMHEFLLTVGAVVTTAQSVDDPPLTLSFQWRDY